MKVFKVGTKIGTRVEVKKVKVKVVMDAMRRNDGKGNHGGVSLQEERAKRYSDYR